jgi:thioredoxin domain-containing protein 5
VLYTVVRPSCPIDQRQSLTVVQDTCEELGITGWPQFNVYRNGQFVETFQKARELDVLKEFIDQYIDEETHPTSPPARKTPTRISNPEGKVLELYERNFSDEIKHGGVFVKFFAPWCGHCKKLAPVWAQLAVQMKNQLTIAEVNCEDHNALCRAEDVQGYPMLFYYGDDGVKSEYTGGRKLEQLQGFVEKVLKP